MSCSSWLSIWLLAAFLAGCHAGTGPEAVPDAGLQPSFTADPKTIASGERSTLSWNVPGATSFEIPGVGYFTGSSASVEPFTTTTYQLNAIGPAGKISLSVTVTVNASASSGPVISSFTVDPPIVTPGASATLSWQVTGATSISILGVGVVTGNHVAVTPSGTTPYVLIADHDGFTATATVVAWEEPATDPATLLAISNAVSSDHLQQLIRETSGASPVVIDGQTVSITERFTPEGKERFRKYFTSYFAGLGLPVTSIDYPANARRRTTEATGHNLEAMLPGRSKDTVVVITHYDSNAKPGTETSNPAADDNMSGMAQIFEAARILQGYQGRLLKTVRFVAADFEELNWIGGTGVEGATQYAYHLSELSTQQGFKIVAAIDPEESAWNCGAAGLCPPQVGGRDFAVTACDVGVTAPDFPTFDFLALENQLRALTALLQPSLNPVRQCDGNVSDHFPFAQIHVPAIMYLEVGNNPFKDEGGDTIDTLDFVYFDKIARVGIPFIAAVVGIAPP